MSALARYFARMGKQVAGYDSTPSPLTQELCNEGIPVHYTDSVNLIPQSFTEGKGSTLIVYTPAIPSNLSELNYFLENGYRVVKRAEALGVIASGYSVAGVAGTHGKTSTSTLLAHLLCGSPLGCDAFLGGISNNFASNLVQNDRGGKRMVVEADEFDRSFLQLHPSLAIITSLDADHLDIYGTYQQVIEAYGMYISNISTHGTLIVNKSVVNKITPWLRNDIKLFTYSINEKADYYPLNLNHTDGYYHFDLSTPSGVIKGLRMGVLGLYNAENAIAASAAALCWGLEHEALIHGLRSFRGVRRRFDVQYRSSRTIYIDDYAHHPEELRATIESARSIFPGRTITGVFQPHLYSRTRDFADGFAQSLSLLDELILLDIYPAREKPIQGVSSNMLLSRVTCPNRVLCSMENVVETLQHRDLDVLITMGAGSIDRITSSITEMLTRREGKA